MYYCASKKNACGKEVWSQGLGMREQLYRKLDAMKERREALGRPYAEATQAELADLQHYLNETAERHAAAAKS